jgi:hypothetical protein
MNRRLLELVDEQHSVDFSVFDSNGDDIITDEELIVVNLRVHTDDSGDAGQRFLCDGTPPPCPTVTMNGMTIAVSVAMGLHGTNFLTWVHETAHIAVQQTDLYDYGVGSLAIGGPTGSNLPDLSFSANAWEKMHWGWATPTVVVKDGFYTVDQAYTTGESFILYDPDKGTNDYFMVENRQQLAGTYDKDATDDGLVIWRIDEAKFNSNSARPIEIMRADGATNPVCNPYCYGGSNGDAWNPADPATPQRTMSRTWRDGTASNVAVRAIGASGNTVRAYFDVRGPGVLVDAYPVDLYGPPKVVAAPCNVAVPVMNAGEAVDTFEFRSPGCPPGDSVPLRDAGSGCGDNVAAGLTPARPSRRDCDGPVTGTSLSDPSVTSTDSMDVQVVHISDLAILGVQADGTPAEMLFGDAHSITVSTKVTNNGPSWPTDATVTMTAVPSAGVQVTPASWTQNLLALAKGEVRELSNTFQVSCQGPGQQSFTFVVEIKPTLATETDLVDTNNTGQVTFVTDCVVPVAINIKPGGFPNAISRNGTAPVAVLTTRAGEYGLPFDFDATKIDPLSVRFGPASLVFPGTGGATAVHGKGHLEDATELDEMTLDGDLDMVLQFRVADSGLTSSSTEACIKGTFTGTDGTMHKFFGCDSVKMSP